MTAPLNALALAGLFALAVGQSATAQEKVTLKLATYLAPTHYLNVQGSEVFMKNTTEATGGKLAWEFYPAGQLGKASDMLPLLLSGAVDAVVTVPSYNADKLPLSSILELPGLAKSSCEATAGVRAVGDPGGVMYEEDFKPTGIRVMMYGILPPYLVISSKPFGSVADFAGAKLRPSGGAMELSVAALGGVGVKMEAPEMYDGLSRGIVDGVMTSFSSAKAYDLQKAGKNVITGYSFGTGAVYLMMTEQRLAALPEDVRAALIEVGKATDQSLCSYMDATEADVQKLFVDEGVDVQPVTAEFAAELDAALKDVPAAWVEKMAGQGRSGEKALEQYRAAFAKN